MQKTRYKEYLRLLVINKIIFVSAKYRLFISQYQIIFDIVDFYESYP